MGSEAKQIKKLYYSIGEVSKMTELKPYVLRYWETEFKQLSPTKNRAGNRTYRQKDINVLIKIKELLYEKKYTIKGAREELVAPEPPEKDIKNTGNNIGSKSTETLVNIKQELEILLEYLHNN